MGGAFLTVLVTILYVIYKALESRPPGVLPLRAWIPFDNLNPVFYWLSSCYEFIIISIGVTINFVYDAFYIGIMMLGVVSVRRFKHRTRITINALIETKKDNVSVRSNELIKLEKKLLHNCIEHHIELLRYI